LFLIAISIALNEPLQKVEDFIHEIPNLLFNLIINTIFIISMIIIGSIGLMYGIIRKKKLKLKRELEESKRLQEEKAEEKRKIKEAKTKSRKIKTQCFENNGIEEQDSYEPEYDGKYRKVVNIRVDKNERYFHKKRISKDEVRYLLKKDYQIKKYKNLLTGRMENFVLKPRFNESFTHLFLVRNISEFLEKNGIEIELYITKKPDIVFRIQDKKYAIEVETGSIFSKISRMKEKLEVLKDYDKWFFVVTDRNKVKKYKKYGDAVDKRYVKQRLDKLIKMTEIAKK